MTTIGLRDGGEFAFLTSRPSPIEWDRSDAQHEIMLFVDRQLPTAAACPAPLKIAWLFEPPEFNPEPYRLMADPNFAGHFDLTLTWNEQLLGNGANVAFMPFGDCWIAPEDRGVRTKTKSVSIIASDKRFLPGHELRHAVVETYGSRLDGVFGRGYVPVENKIEALGDYRYTVVIENVRRNWWFTEKLIDAFVTGTVPIYWGCPDIGRFFDPEGMIIVESLEDVGRALDNLSEEDWERRRPAIERNMQLAHQYTEPSHLFEKVVFPRLAEIVARKAAPPPPRVPAGLQACGNGTVIEEPFHLTTPEAAVIGADTYIGPQSYIAADGGLEIGDGVMIGPMVYIQTSNHNFDSTDLQALPYDHRIIRRPIRIDSFAWLGGRVTLTPGVRIGAGAIVGAGSVVVDDVPERGIVAGNPARLIGYRDRDQFQQLASRGMTHMRHKRETGAGDVWHETPLPRVPRADA
jgi:acetyltransferase-like isoleucine patch superfamily enzyme